MSRLCCLCGNAMSNSDVPSDSIALIYTSSYISKCIAVQLALLDLWDDNYECWYCQKCKRITVIDRKTGKYLRSYLRVAEDRHLFFAEVETWQELMFWRDREWDNATEEDDKLTVEDFVKKYPSRYLIRLSPDESKALVFSPQTKDYLFSYIQDPMPDFSKLD